MFAKIFSDIFESGIADDYLTRIVFQDMLILCDSDGMLNMTIEAFARRTNVPIEIIKQAIEKLESPDPRSRSQVHEGRRIVRNGELGEHGWTVVNYVNFRETRSSSDRREYRRQWMATKRESDPSYCRNTEKTGNGEHLVNSGERGEPKKKEKKIGEAKASPSEKGMGFAAWFRGTLSKTVKLSENWQTQWAGIYDDLIRLDKRTPAQIRDVCQWAREDDFWRANFLSPAKLRQRDKNKVFYFDVFMAKMSDSHNGNGTGKPQTDFSGGF